MKIICDWENCKNVGSYKAPIEKDNSRNYRLLCLEHIKIFNKSWNYFENMSNEEIEYFIKSDLTWHKLTKSFSSSENFFNILWNNALSDKFNIFNKEDSFTIQKKKLSEKDKDAFRRMDLEFSADWNTIQKKVKTLVKKFHPDKHGGNRQYEDKLKKITLAYSHLKMKIIK